MTLPELISDLRGDAQFMMNVAAWRTLPAAPAQLVPIPEQLAPALHAALHGRAINQLYSHQADALNHALGGQNVVVVTPTASGKTLCYLLPTFDALLNDPRSRALLLYPTKALAQDQLAEINSFLALLTDSHPPADGVGKPSAGLSAAVYDGDTPSSARSRIRSQARIMLSNPDMLHMGILPYHSQWAAFLAGLRYVVIDELHTYRGVFGSHVANVLRRLLRLCNFYGSHPQVICTSATIANPQQLAERLIEQPVQLVERNGAARGEKHIILYNPPMVDVEHGLRRSAVLVTEELAARCISAGAQTIVFGRSRLTTELLLTYLRQRLSRKGTRLESGNWPTSGRSDEQHSPNLQFPISNPQSLVRGYRGGYLPAERRAIEAGLRGGEVRAVVATNALELGIDIGQLQAAVLCGYPGTIASTWQQMGRAGRSTQTSLALMVATSQPIDQYIVQHPEFLFERSPESALTNPDNLMLLVDQMRCAAFELPFEQEDRFGECPFTEDVLELLAEQGSVARHGGRWLWSGASYPARQISLRSTGSDVVAIQLEPRGEFPDAPPNNTPGAGSQPTAQAIIGEVDVASAQILVHDGAVYLHDGQSHLVRKLDLEQRIAHVVRQDVDFYTVVDSEVQVQVLAVRDAAARGGAQAAHGDVIVHSRVTGYRRRKHMTHEMLGVWPLDYPAQTMETTAYWLSVSQSTQRALAAAGSWFDSVNDYGPNWAEQRERVRVRDRFRCTRCGVTEPAGRQHDVHHLTPFRIFGYTPGFNDAYKQANRLENLVLVCRTCHQRLEAGVRTRGALDGLGYVLHSLAPLHLMCDRSDLGVHVERGVAPALAKGEMRDGVANGDAGEVDFYEQAVITATVTPPVAPARTQQEPAIYLYERVPTGLGFSALLFELHNTLLAAAYELIAQCPCTEGCPGCVGPVFEGQAIQLETKRLTLELVAALQR